MEPKLTSRETDLIRCFSVRNADHTELVTKLTKDIDVDTEDLNYMLMLSFVGYRVGWTQFPPEIVPRIKGFFKFYQASNLVWLDWMLSIFRALALQGIPVLALRDAAMRFYYDAGKPRIMQYFDLAVPAGKLQQVKAYFEKEDHFQIKTLPSGVLQVEGINSLKKLRFQIHGADILRGIWERARKVSLKNTEFYVPGALDMILFVPLELISQFEEADGWRLRIKWIYDAVTVIENSEKFMIPADEECIYRELGMCKSAYLLKMLEMIDSERFQMPDALRDVTDSHNYGIWYKNLLCWNSQRHQMAQAQGLRKQVLRLQAKKSMVLCQKAEKRVID